MPLSSQLLKGDVALEAAALYDSSHILPGSSGQAVVKIQQALNLLEQAGLTPDGKFGPGTAAAVLAFKKKRGLIRNDVAGGWTAIVGKGTVAALDRELAEIENRGEGRVKLEPLFINRPVLPDSVFTVKSFNTRGFAETTSISSPVSAKTTSAFPFSPQKLTRFEVNNHAIEIKVGQKGRFRVVNGKGGTVYCDPKIAVVSNPNKPQVSVAGMVSVSETSEEFDVTGLHEGVTTIYFDKPFTLLMDLPLPIALVVRPNIVARDFSVHGIEHNHKPCGRWKEVQWKPRNSFYGHSEGGMTQSLYFSQMCSGCDTPKCVMEKLRKDFQSTMPGYGTLVIAADHLDWYLHGGGREYNEDNYIKAWMKSDNGLKKVMTQLYREIPDKRGKKEGVYEFTQGLYENDDFRNSWGSLDKMHWEFNFDLDECTIWWKDRYEWHPYYPAFTYEYEGKKIFYPPMYDVQAGDDDPRTTNCVHAAAVEMKSQGAADYWMKGQATVPIKDVLLP